jgi:hypothetical protein
MAGRSRSSVRKAAQPAANAATSWRESGFLTPVAALAVRGAQMQKKGRPAGTRTRRSPKTELGPPLGLLEAGSEVFQEPKVAIGRRLCIRKMAAIRRNDR